MHKFFKSLLEIVKLYTMLFLVLGFCYLLIRDIELGILNIVFMVVLIIGVFVDNRFNGKSKVMIVIISIIQILLYYYLELIPILIVKDLFGYSVVLNMCFIGHVIILHGLFEISIYYKWDYGNFIFSRISVITSLTGLYGLLMFLVRVQKEIEYYYHLTKREIGSSEKILKFIVDSNIIEYLLYIISYVVLYFIKNFTDYCLVLLGKSKFGELFKSMDRFFNFYGLFVFTLLISIFLMGPRIYIIGIGCICQKTYKVIKMIISYGRSDFPYDGITIFYMTFNQSFRPPFYFNSVFSEELLKIYDKEFFLEYKVYLDLDNFFPNDFGYTSNIYDICEIFVYSKMRRHRIVLLYLLNYYGDSGGVSDSELDDYEKEYNLIPIESDDCVPFTREPNFPGKRFDGEKGSLFQYISLEEGIYLND